MRSTQTYTGQRVSYRKKPQELPTSSDVTTLDCSLHDIEMFQKSRSLRQHETFLTLSSAHPIGPHQTDSQLPFFLFTPECLDPAPPMYVDTCEARGAHHATRRAVTQISGYHSGTVEAPQIASYWKLACGRNTQLDLVILEHF